MFFAMFITQPEDITVIGEGFVQPTPLLAFVYLKQVAVEGSQGGSLTAPSTPAPCRDALDYTEDGEISQEKGAAYLVLCSWSSRLALPYVCGHYNDKQSKLCTPFNHFRLSTGHDKIGHLKKQALWAEVKQMSIRKVTVDSLAKLPAFFFEVTVGRESLITNPSATLRAAFRNSRHASRLIRGQIFMTRLIAREQALTSSHPAV